MGGGGTPQPIYQGAPPIEVTPFAYLYQPQYRSSPKGQGPDIGLWDNTFLRPAVMPRVGGPPDIGLDNAVVRPAVMPGGIPIMDRETLLYGRRPTPPPPPQKQAPAQTGPQQPQRRTMIEELFGRISEGPSFGGER